MASDKIQQQCTNMAAASQNGGRTEPCAGGPQNISTLGRGRLTGDQGPLSHETRKCSSLLPKGEKAGKRSHLCSLCVTGPNGIIK